MFILGITGGIASGKTTVSQIFSKRYDLPLISFDDISRAIVRPGMPLNTEIRNLFGDEAMLYCGNINREYLRKLICTDAEKRKQIDDLFNPYMKLEFEERIEKLSELNTKIIIVENALIFEFNQYNQYDKIIVVGCSIDDQVKRIVNRDNQTIEDSLGIIKSQLPLESKRKLADYFILNNGTIDDLAKQIDSIFIDISIFIVNKEELLRRRNY